MKKTFAFNGAILIAIIGLVGWATTQTNSNTTTENTFALNKDSSTLIWKGFAIHKGEVDHSHHGTIEISSGTLTQGEKGYVGNFEIDMATIKDVDLQPGPKKNLLENKLKGMNFFNIELSPKTAVAIKELTDSTAELTLTAFSISVTDTVPVRLTVENNKLLLSGKFGFDFTKMKMPSFGLDDSKSGISPVVQFDLNAVLDKK